jgi:hypothetical protein
MSKSGFFPEIKIIGVTMEQREMDENSEEWEKFIAIVHESNTEFAKGIVGEVTQAVWTHSNNATIFGRYGGGAGLG